MLPLVRCYSSASMVEAATETPSTAAPETAVGETAPPAPATAASAIPTAISAPTNHTGSHPSPGWRRSRESSSYKAIRAISASISLCERQRYV